MKNPFVYGSIVTGDDFCNRIREQKDIKRAIDNNERLFIYAERRTGKTSLIKQIVSHCNKRKYICIYIDLWPINSELDFIKTCAKAISESIATVPGKLIDVARKFFSSLSPTITIDSEGKPVLSFGLRDSPDSGIDFNQVFNIPLKTAMSKNVAIIFDEFQQLIELGSGSVEKKLRSVIQEQKDIAFIFLGSKKHLLQRMFLDKSRPLYKSAGHYPLEPIKSDDWIKFIRTKFTSSGKTISDNQIKSILLKTDGHSFYTQHLCHLVWDECEEDCVSEIRIQNAVTTLLERENYAYTALWESLTINQHYLLIAISGEETASPFSSGFIQKYKLKSASSVQRAADHLMKSDIIDREKGRFVITDRFFKLWIRYFATMT